MTKRNDGELPAPLEGITDAPITRARAMKLLGAMGATGAFALFAGGTAEARPNRRRRRRRRRRIRRERARRQNNITSSESNSFVSPGVNVPVTEDVIVVNNGTEPVVVSPTIDGQGFELVNAGDITLQPGENTIPVTFTPSVGGVSTGELRLVDADDGLLLETVDLTGTVTAPVNP